MPKKREIACMHCFRDKRLRDFIKEYASKSNCHWCGARNTYTIPIWELGSLFRDVVSIYEPTSWDMGDDVSFLLQEDWSVFSERIEEAPNNLMQEMTVTILEVDLDPKDDVDEPNYGGSFCRPTDGLEDSWHEKIEKLLTMDKSNGGETQKIQDDIDWSPTPDDRLDFALEELSREYDDGAIFHRARIHDERTREERFGLHELGAPPPERARAGRANKQGEPVLYLASDETTALSEVRAWKGLAVAIATIRLQHRIRVIDLRHFDIPESPFFEEHLSWRLELAGLFHRFSEELYRPVMPDEQSILYQPSQHLCDIIRQAGYDGVIFPSAMGRGFNAVIFDPTVAEVLEIKYYRVLEVCHRFEELRDNEPLYDETPYDYLLSSKKNFEIYP